jgi:hypothetical protein
VCILELNNDVVYRLSRSGLTVASNQTIEFQGPIISNVAYSSDIKTINITYTGVTDIELRNPNGFEVDYLFIYLFH